MQITVRLFASHRAGRFNEAVLDYPPGVSVGDGVQALSIARKELGIVLVNGRLASLDQKLNEGDTLALFPLVSGG